VTEFGKKLRAQELLLNQETACSSQCTSSGVPRVSRARGQRQFWRPHPAPSWQRRCKVWVGS